MLFQQLLSHRQLLHTHNTRQGRLAGVSCLSVSVANEQNTMSEHPETSWQGAMKSWNTELLYTQQCWSSGSFLEKMKKKKSNWLYIITIWYHFKMYFQSCLKINKWIKTLGSQCDGRIPIQNFVVSLSKKLNLDPWPLTLMQWRQGRDIFSLSPWPQTAHRTLSSSNPVFPSSRPCLPTDHTRLNNKREMEYKIKQAANYHAR